MSSADVPNIGGLLFLWVTVPAYGAAAYTPVSHQQSQAWPQSGILQMQLSQFEQKLSFWKVTSVSLPACLCDRRQRIYIHGWSQYLSAICQARLLCSSAMACTASKVDLIFVQG